jgi:hypothetical protein
MMASGVAPPFNRRTTSFPLYVEPRLAFSFKPNWWGLDLHFQRKIVDPLLTRIAQPFLNVLSVEATAAAHCPRNLD